jgi:hypothetical protein
MCTQCSGSGSARQVPLPPGQQLNPSTAHKGLVANHTHTHTAGQPTNYRYCPACLLSVSGVKVRIPSSMAYSLAPQWEGAVTCR